MRRAILKITPKVLAAALGVDAQTAFIAAGVSPTDGDIELVVAISRLPEVAEGTRYPCTDLATLQGTDAPPTASIQHRQYVYEGNVSNLLSWG